MLTSKELEALKPGPARREIPAGNGLFFILQPSGAASWAVRYRFNGTPRKHTLGAWPAIGLKAARDLTARAKVAIADGRDPGAEKIEARRAVRFPDDHDLIEKVVDQFIASYARRNLKGSTATEVERILHKEIVGAWRGRRLCEIKRPDVHRLLDAIIDRGAPVASNRTLAWLRKLCNWAVERGLIEASPCAGITAPSMETSRERVLNDSELKAVWTTAGALGWPYGNAVKMLILTGQRRSEVTEMRWSELDFDAKTWTLPAARTKNGREHVVPLPEPAVAILRAAPRVGSEFVFTFDGAKPIAAHHIKYRLGAHLPEDMAAWTIHDVRRTFASGLARLGVAVHVTEKLLNHASGTFGGITGVYQRHSYASEQRSAVEAWARFVDALVTGAPATNIVDLSAARG